jgi:hypothetical protein
MSILQKVKSEELEVKNQIIIKNVIASETKQSRLLQ